MKYKERKKRDKNPTRQNKEPRAVFLKLIDLARLLRKETKVTNIKN